MVNSRRPAVVRSALIVTAVIASSAHVKAALAQSALSFTAGDLVVSVEGNGSNTAATQSGNTGSAAGTYEDNQAAPVTLFEYSLGGTSNATQVGSLMLPQVSTPGGNYAVSGEYGSSSEGTLQLSGNGQYLTIMGYATNAQSYNATSDLNGGGTSLAQSPNPVGGGSGSVLRDIALIGANGTVNSTTAISGVFNENNPRSVYTQNGTSFYISGQGDKDATGGVFYVSQLGATTATAITGLDTSKYNQDTRDVQIVNGQLTVSVDSTEVSAFNIDRIGTLTAPGGGLPTTTLNQQPTALPGINGAVTLANGNGNSINQSTGSAYLSPEGFFYANSTTLYVADSGEPKNGSSQGSAGAPNPGDGGLQKWSLVGGAWQLDYTLAAGLNLVPNDNDQTNGAGHGVSGLEGLTGQVVNGQVELFATSYVLGDTDQTYLYGITDTLADTTASQAAGESFTTLAAAPADSEFKGVSFAPVPLPSGISLLLGGLAAFGIFARRGARPQLTV
jgi:hypothetical protein